MELYIHIPFCIKKCLYCDFLSFASDDTTKRAYVNALLFEIEKKVPLYRDKLIDTIFIGGGTPTSLPADYISYIMEKIFASFNINPDAEITIECNPGSMGENPFAYLLTLHKAGINRLSIGLQSTHDDLLQTLGRIHSYEDFTKTFKYARLAGFNNINIDLISAIPGQSVEQYDKTLREICALEPDHISAYSLIIEEGTPFYDLYHFDEEARDAGKETAFLPSEDDDRKMYELTSEILAEHGYYRYEISNYAKTGSACLHNIGYWTGVDYLGLGLGASSLINGTRFTNTEDIASYNRGDFGQYNVATLSKEDMMGEFMYLGLRLTMGISKKIFANRFGCEIDEVWPGVVDRLVELELLTVNDDNIRLTKKGLSLSNQVFVEFV